jgi:hypothetical protein
MEPNRFGDITAFIAVVKAGSFTAAASSLGLTRSAVGKSIVRLETQLGVRLLNRTTRKLSLTDERRDGIRALAPNPGRAGRSGCHHGATS